MNKRFVATLVALALVLLPVVAFAAPTVSEFTKAGTKNTNVTFTEADFTGHYTDEAALTAIRFPALPASSEGVIKIGEADAAAATNIPLAELGTIVFVPATDFTGSVTVNWEAYNDTDYSAAAAITITISEPPANVKPIIAAFTKIGTKNTTLNFLASDFTNHYTDDSSLVSIQFSTLPNAAEGVLNLESTAINAGQVIPAADLGKINFVPVTDYVGSATANWKASDGELESDAAVLTITIETPAPAPTFEYLDMQDHWANDQAVEMALKNILRGEQVGGNFYFEPERPINRGDFVRFLNASLGITLSTPDDEDFDFIDKATMPAWLYNQGKIAYEAGIISGVGESNGVAFEPYAALTRIEAIKMIDNILETVAPTTPETLTFTDANQIPGWGVSAVQALLSANVIAGYDDNTLRPNRMILREDSVVMLSNMLEHTPESETTAHIFTSKIND